MDNFVVLTVVENSLLHATGPCSALVSVYIEKFSSRLRPVSTQENKHGIGPDRNKIKTTLRLSVPIFCSSLNL